MFISEIIYEQYRLWKQGDIVIIHAQTGAGKTFFVFEKLLPFIKGEGKRLLYLSNRSALKEQVNLSYSADFSQDIVTMNYQQFEKLNLHENFPSESTQSILSCDYWIMDEAHYFLADATFNDEILQCLSRIKNARQNRILVFMTATVEYLLLSLGQLGFFQMSPPESSFVDGVASLPHQYLCPNYLKNANLVFQLSSLKNLMEKKELSDVKRNIYEAYIYAKENAMNVMPFLQQMNRYMVPTDISDIFQKKYKRYEKYFTSAKQDVLYYSTGAAYNYVNPVYFKDICQLCNQIKRTSPTEKWMVFVSSKSVGEDIQDLLSDMGIKSTMITATTKTQKSKKSKKKRNEYEVYREIIEKGKSPERVTISTAVLDNGINLKDPQLKHMVILEMNPTTFLQMLGRKRLSENDCSLTVYLQSKDLRSLRSFFCQSILKYAKFLAELQFISIASQDKNFHQIQTARKEKVAIWQQNICDFAQTYQVNGTFKEPYSHFVKNIRVRGKDNRLLNYTHNTAIIFEPNPYTSARLSYDYYRMLALFEEYENTPDDYKAAKKDRLWIEHQLSWLGLKYDPACWIDYKKHLASKKRLKVLLFRYEGSALSKNKSKKIKQVVRSIVSTAHPPMSVRLGKASLSKVNEALAELGYDKQIISKNRSINGIQRNYWMIVPIAKK